MYTVGVNPKGPRCCGSGLTCGVLQWPLMSLEDIKATAAAALHVPSHATTQLIIVNLIQCVTEPR